jgi:hypothetical protein
LEAPDGYGATLGPSTWAPPSDRLASILTIRDLTAKVCPIR